MRIVRKLASAARRRVFEARLRRERVRPWQITHLGSDYGGWWVPADLIDESWICYSAGAGADVSFDSELVERFGATVRGFDPFHLFGTRAIEAVGDAERYSFHVVALAAEDGPLEVYGRQDLVKGSVSAVNLYGVDSEHVVSGRSLPSLMRELGDQRIDLLKLDIEGSEYEVLEPLDLPSLGIRVLCVELHHNEPARRAKALLGRLRDQGYEVIFRGGGSEFTLLRTEVPPSAVVDMSNQGEAQVLGDASSAVSERPAP
jgi:FkbM family methyltransferase